MENAKDIQKTDNLSHFLESQVRTNPFGNNISGERIYRRAERIVVALYLLTNHIPQEEPSRIEVRKAGFDLLSHILMLDEEMRAPTSHIFHNTLTIIRKLISIVRIYPAGGYISFQNAHVTAEALDELANFLLVSQRSTLSENITLSKDDLLGPEGPIVPSVVKRTQHLQAASPIKDKIDKQASIKDNKDTNRTQEEGGSLDRRSISILNILKSQGIVGIKDIAANLPEYSEKMIQRELAQLVSLGRVKKIGFKRWSRYEFIV